MSATLSSTKWEELKKKLQWSNATLPIKKRAFDNFSQCERHAVFFSSSSSGCCLPAMCCQDASVCWAFAKKCTLPLMDCKCDSMPISDLSCFASVVFFFSFNIHLFPLLKEQHYQKKDKNSEEWRRREACFNNFYFIHQEEQGNKNKKALQLGS